MERNVGTVDRITRAALAALATVGAGVLGPGTIAGIALIVVAVILGATAIIAICPLYKLVGTSTCPMTST